MRLPKNICGLFLGWFVMAPAEAGEASDEAAETRSRSPVVEAAELSRVDIAGIELHYVERGEGEPLILIHGSLADLSYWEWSNQIAPLAEHFRVIAYSRRYNHPNRNEPGEVGDHSSVVEAGDLLALLDGLGIASAHIIGHSYGAYTALVFALDHPGRVLSVTLAEPPILSWLPEIPGGAEIHGQFFEKVWKPMGRAFAEGGDEAGLNFTSRWYFGEPINRIQREWATLFVRNVREWRALALSADAFPMIDLARVQSFAAPTLLLSGGRNAGKFNDMIDSRLAELLPHAGRIVIENAGHEMFLDDSAGSARAMLGFLVRVRDGSIATSDPNE